VPDLGQSDSGVLYELELLNEARERVKAAKCDAAPDEERLEATRAYATAADEYSTARALATSRISSTAIASGYASGIAALVLLVIPVTLMGGSLFSLRLAICGAGAAWGLGTIRQWIGWIRACALLLTGFFILPLSQPRRSGSALLPRLGLQCLKARSSGGRA